MPTLEKAIHNCFVVGVVAMLVAMVFMTIRFLTTGTDAHQNECKEKVKAATKPDTSKHEAYYAGFFHPYPNAGGGGERVLWTMIKAIQEKYPFVVSVIYSGDKVDRDALLLNVKSKFGMDIKPETIYVVELTRRSWVDYKYPRLTLLLQSIGSVVLASEALNKFMPDIFIETVGYAFTYPLVRMVTARIPAVSYTHYPAISSDMQTMVSSRESGFNNDAKIAQSSLLTCLKSLYYQAFGYAYSYAGSFAATIMTNSSWTHNHIVRLFDKPKMTRVVYPPCDTKALTEFPTSNRMPFVVSLAQFRPEKNHKTQVEAFAKFLDSNIDYKLPTTTVAPTPESLLASAQQYEVSGTWPAIAQYPMLIMMGGARNIEDEARAEELRQLAKKLGVERQVHVIVNAPWSQVLEWLKFGRVGMHTMKDEHFGINIVEMLAAGLLTVGHDSAGPKLDIITPAIRISEDGAPAVPSELEAKEFLASNKDDDKKRDKDDEEKTFPVGMVAKSADEFAKMIQLGLEMPEITANAVRKAARHAAATKFSEAAFVNGFYKRFDPVIRWLDYQRSDEDDDDDYE